MNTTHHFLVSYLQQCLFAKELAGGEDDNTLFFAIGVVFGDVDFATSNNVEKVTTGTLKVK